MVSDGSGSPSRSPRTSRREGDGPEDMSPRHPVWVRLAAVLALVALLAFVALQIL